MKVLRLPRLTDRVVWAGKRIREFGQRIRGTFLGISGLGCLNTAVWINSVTWGFVATGVTLLLMQYLTEDKR